MGNGYARKWVSGNDKDLYYVIQDTTTEENNTTDKDTPMCVETKFDIIKHTNLKQ